MGDGGQWLCAVADSFEAFVGPVMRSASIRTGARGIFAYHGMHAMLALAAFHPEYFAAMTMAWRENANTETWEDLADGIVRDFPVAAHPPAAPGAEPEE